MGKIKKQQSDNEMDIQNGQQLNQNQPIIPKTVKKNKKISKTKQPNQKENVSSNKFISHKDMIHRTAKMVNCKQKQRPLQQKQQIFKKLIKGLQTNKQTKKQKIKSRMLLKKQLSKALSHQPKAESKPSTETSQMQTQTDHHLKQRKKKDPINEKQQSQKIRLNMGQSLSSLKSMLSKNYAS